MHKADIITHLHSAFRTFDAKARPQGLYAIDEYPASAKPKPLSLADWQFIAYPALERLGYKTLKKIPARTTQVCRFHCLGPADRMDIELFRFSKIKVRLYGNAYRIDPHFDFAGRWRQLGLAGRIRSNAHLHPDNERLLLLIAFAKGPRSLDPELSKLHEKLGATEQSTTYTEDHWPDPQALGFETFCVSWHWPVQS